MVLHPPLINHKIFKMVFVAICCNCVLSGGKGAIYSGSCLKNKKKNISRSPYRRGDRLVQSAWCGLETGVWTVSYPSGLRFILPDSYLSTAGTSRLLILISYSISAQMLTRKSLNFEKSQAEVLSCEFLNMCRALYDTRYKHELQDLSLTCMVQQFLNIIASKSAMRLPPPDTARIQQQRNLRPIMIMVDRASLHPSTLPMTQVRKAKRFQRFCSQPINHISSERRVRPSAFRRTGPEQDDLVPRLLLVCTPRATPDALVYSTTTVLQRQQWWATI